MNRMQTWLCSCTYHLVPGHRYGGRERRAAHLRRRAASGYIRRGIQNTLCYTAAYGQAISCRLRAAMLVRQSPALLKTLARGMVGRRSLRFPLAVPRGQ